MTVFIRFLRTTLCLIGLGWWMACSSLLLAQNEISNRGDDKERAAAALQLTKEYAERYEITSATDAKKSVLVPRPILRWSNPERGEIYGNVFLWTLDGRPQAVGSLYKWYSPFTHMSHEFHSLSTTGLQGNYDGKSVWKTDRPGITFTDVADGPAFADKPAARLTQMRELARRFSASGTDADGKRTELRLLAQPVYRYEVDPAATKPEFVDGAVFAFVEGTDPEVWLLLEADASTGKWRYALARMNRVVLTANYQGTEVWRCETIGGPDLNGHQGPYTVFGFNKP
ncbi:MAG: hypothetical protein Q8K78_12585 [Planctomycetaceae bacterium]|nr:hypothetical protein [Planctomycetaceae bacterium]